MPKELDSAATITYIRDNLKEEQINKFIKCEKMTELLKKNNFNKVKTAEDLTLFASEWPKKLIDDVAIYIKQIAS